MNPALWSTNFLQLCPPVWNPKISSLISFSHSVLGFYCYFFKHEISISYKMLINFKFLMLPQITISSLQDNPLLCSTKQLWYKGCRCTIAPLSALPHPPLLTNVQVVPAHIYGACRTTPNMHATHFRTISHACAQWQENTAKNYSYNLHEFH
jgi:hypothetical protein